MKTDMSTYWDHLLPPQHSPAKERQGRAGPASSLDSQAGLQRCSRVTCGPREETRLYPLGEGEGRGGRALKQWDLILNLEQGYGVVVFMSLLFQLFMKYSKHERKK